jgi:uncharacterized membrane protein YvbJ
VALVDCPECGKQVSTLAAACPHCGFPVSRRAAESQAPTRERGPARWTDPGFWVIVIGLLVVIILSIALLRQTDREPAGNTTVPVATTNAVGTAESWAPARPIAAPLT